MSNDINVQTLIMGNLLRLGGTGRMFLCSNEHGNYIFKPSEDRENQKRIDNKAYIQEAAYEIQKIIDPTMAVPCQVATINGMFGTVQELIDVDRTVTETFRNNVINGEELQQSQLEDVLREYIVDYLICNYDTHERNFIVDANGRVRGIDKEQGCRFIEEDNANSPLFNTNYNARYGEEGSIYALIFERIRNGMISKDNIDILTKHIQRINEIPNEEYIKIFQKYIDSLDGDKTKVTDGIIERKERLVTLVEELKQNLDSKPPKFTKDDYKIIHGILSNEIDMISGLRNYIPNLSSIIENLDEYENESELNYRIYEELAERIDKKDFLYIKNMKCNKYLIFTILKHSEDFDLKSNEIIDLIESSQSVELINKCLGNQSLIADEGMRRKIAEIKEELLTKTIYSQAEDGTIYERGKLRFTEDELDSIKIYIGEDIGSEFYTGDDKTYTIINGLMRSGIVFSELGPPNRNKVLCSIIEKPKDFLQICENLYSAMHKYGKCIETPIHAVRAETAVEDLLDSGMTRSFFSMTIGENALQGFSRDYTSELEADVMNGTDCINVADILQGDYSMANENEILIAPYIPFDSEVIEEKQVEKKLYDDRKIICMKKKCQLEFAHKQRLHALSQEEKEDYQNDLRILMDEDIRKMAIMYVNSYGGTAFYEGLKVYKVWREAFQKVFAYRQREIALDIDNSLLSRGITFQQIGKGTAKTFCQNIERGIKAIDTLEKGVRAQEERKCELTQEER
mgnify:FL=1